MATRIQLLFSLAVGAAVSFVTAVMADEGAVAAKVTSTTTALEVIPVGIGDDHVFVHEEQGTIERGGGSHSWRCVWIGRDYIRWEGRGYCIETDQDGDQIVLKTTDEGYGLTGSGVGEVVRGAGKYAGITGKIAFTCHFAGDISKHTANCDAQVSYKMP
jgi:hypothetical protein